MTPRQMCLYLVGLLVVGFAVTGCQAVKVSRIPAEEQTDLTDRWNDTDSRLVANEMIGDMLNFSWIQPYQTRTGRTTPTVIVQNIYNRSHEHISVATFINDLKRAAIRSGKVDFVVGGIERSAVREERADQELHAKVGTEAPMGQEQGADFGLSGSIDSIVDQLGGQRVTYYQVDLKLIDLASNREVWNGQKKIKKLQQRSRFGL